MDIFTAAEKGDIGALTQLIAADPALVRQYREDGWTALHLAAYYGHPEAVEVFLGAGADVMSRSRNSMENTALHAAAAGRNARVISVLLAAGTDVNATQNGGWTALHSAAQNGDVALLELLLASGANPNLLSTSGESALSLAIAKNHAEAVKLLSPK